MIITSRNQFRVATMQAFAAITPNEEMREKMIESMLDSKNENSMKFEKGFRVIVSADQTSISCIGITPTGACCGAFAYRIVDREYYLAERKYEGPINKDEVYMLIKDYHARVMNFGFEDEDIENMFAKGIPKLEKMIRDQDSNMDVIKVSKTANSTTITCGINGNYLLMPEHKERFDELMGKDKTIVFDLTMYEPRN